MNRKPNSLSVLLDWSVKWSTMVPFCYLTPPSSPCYTPAALPPSRPPSCFPVWLWLDLRGRPPLRIIRKRAFAFRCGPSYQWIPYWITCCCLHGPLVYCKNLCVCVCVEEDCLVCRGSTDRTFYTCWASSWLAADCRTIARWWLN